MNPQNDLFLLMFTLSQMEDRVKIVRFFCESLNELFKPNEFEFSENKPPHASHYYEEIILGDISFGFVKYKTVPSKEQVAILQNAIQMLAVILDRLRIDGELKNKISSFKSIAQKRLDAIKANVKELENYRKESTKLIENLKSEIVRREKIENELRESEEKFRLSFRTSPDSVNINRLEDGLYIEINPGFTEITGYAADEVIGKTSYEIDVWADFRDREELVRGLKEKGKYYNLEAKFRTKDGRILDGLMSAAIINLNNVPHIINITRDITEIKKAQNDLKKSELQFRKAFENSTSGMCIASVKGEFLQVNAKLCQILGYTEEELLKSTFPEVTYPGDIPMGEENMKNALDGQIDSFYMEKRYIRKDGTIIWADVSSSLIRDSENLPVNFITQVTDITENKMAGEVLKKERDLAQQYLDVAGVMFATLNKKGEITLINKKGFEILGYDKAEDLIGKNWLEVCLPEKNKKEIKDIFREQMAGNIKAYEYYENLVLTKSGKERIIAFHNTVLHDADGKISGVLFSGEDITERVKAEEEIKELNAVLEKRVVERTTELEGANKELSDINDVFVGREMRIIELKEEIKRLKNQLKEK